MKWLLLLFMLNDKGVVAIKQVKGLPSEQVCKTAGEEAQRLDPKHVQSFKCEQVDGPAKK